MWLIFVEWTFNPATLAQATEGTYFSEIWILHVQKTHQCYIVYVTDYTANEKLAAVTGPWCPPALAGRVAMMEAWSGAVDFVANMSTGEYYWIKNVRMKELGDGALIGKLNDNNFQELKEGDDLNRNFTSLIERKMAWRTSNVETSPHISRPIPNAEPTIGGEHPNKKHITARIIDFRPWNLRQVAIIYCKKCEQNLLLNSEKTCFKCRSSDQRYFGYKYQIYLDLQTNDGTELRACLDDRSPVFDGLQRVDVDQDFDGFIALSDRLSPIFGDKLLRAHAGPASKDKLSPNMSDSPWLSLALRSNDCVGGYTYRVVGYEKLV
ncbi:hypothetical protein H0H81_007183 [Sphagnurus paluster]|uniref:Uncharacterized protein n=1 Tax=Sphagnurus paluster TaxID=117069 RepID=A0A9P7KIQ7_9AGAR|nr:hypothetical protein H0H81_007183 [Sphagnurus paluster]